MRESGKVDDNVPAAAQLEEERRMRDELRELVTELQALELRRQ